MRLFTHNILVCNVKACQETAQRTTSGASNFPLKIVLAENGIKQEVSEYNQELILKLLPKIDWNALRSTVASLGIAQLPLTVPENPIEHPDFLKSVHDLVMDVHIMNGNLICPNCERAYPVVNGIPNMLLNDDEL